MRLKFGLLLIILQTNLFAQPTKIEETSKEKVSLAERRGKNIPALIVTVAIASSYTYKNQDKIKKFYKNIVKSIKRKFSKTDTPKNGQNFAY